jgi:hypothetical protein
MTDRVFDKTLDLMLAYVGEASEIAYVLYQVLQGDVDDPFSVLEKYGYVDENQEWIYK